MADYLSNHTGAEIDTAISAVPNKIDKSSIVNDFTTGGTTSVASAETVKTLKAQLDVVNASAVKTSGNQSVAGNKTFSGNITFTDIMTIQAGKKGYQPNDAVEDTEIANLKVVKQYALSADSAGDGLSYSVANKRLSVKLSPGLQFSQDTKSIAFDYASITNKNTPETNDTLLVFNTNSALHRRINITEIGVQSFKGRKGTVVPAVGDYTDVMVEYTRADANKKSISSSSDTVGAAINDLDDLKAARTELATLATKSELNPLAPKDNPTFTGVIKTDKGSATSPVIADSANTDTGLYFTADSVNVTVDGLTEATFKRNEVSFKKVFKLGTSTNYLNTEYTSSGMTVTPYVSGSASASTFTFDSASGTWKFESKLHVQAPTASTHATTKQYVDDLVAQAASPVPPSSVDIPATGSADVLTTTAFHPRSMIALVHYYDTTTNNTLVCSLYIVRNSGGVYVVSQKSVEKTYGTDPLAWTATYSAGTFKLTATNSTANVIITKAKVVSVQE